MSGKRELLDLVMIIDDHDISNFMAQQVIINSNIASRSVIQPAGFSAINYLKKYKDRKDFIPEVIFLDIDMPVLDGFEFIERFVKLPEEITAHCKIVILSAHDKMKEMKKWMDDGTVIYYIIKPLTPFILEEFKRSQAYRQLLK